MIKQIILCFVVAIAITVAGAALCQSESFIEYYCALLFVCTFGAMVCTCAFWSDLQGTLKDLSEDSKRTIVGDTIACTVLAWVLPVSTFLMGLLYK